MEIEQMVACPRCGSEPELVKLYDNTEITTAKCSNSNCKHSSVTGLDETMARKLWNIRAGGRKPAVPETAGVKALASATGSVTVCVMFIVWPEKDSKSPPLAMFQYREWAEEWMKRYCATGYIEEFKMAVKN
jgi:hypothetical protein